MNALTNRIHNLNGVITLVWLKNHIHSTKLSVNRDFKNLVNLKLKCDLNISLMQYDITMKYTNFNSQNCKDLKATSFTYLLFFLGHNF